MAKKDHKDIDLEILTSFSKLDDYVEKLEGKINDLMMRVNNTKSDSKLIESLRVRVGALKKIQEHVNRAKSDSKLVKALRVRVGALKKTQEDVDQRFNYFTVKNLRFWMKTMKNFQYDKQGNLEISERFKDVKEGIEAFKKEEDNVKGRLNELIESLIKGEEQCVDDAACEFVGLQPHQDEDDLKKSLIEWSKASSEEGEAVKAVKDRAVELGTELSFLVVNLVFNTLEREGLLAIFENFKSFLMVFKDESFMLMSKIIAVLETMTDGKMKEMRKAVKESIEGSSKTMKDTELNMNELREGLVEESQIAELLIQILEAVVGLEYILKHPRLPHSKMSKKEDAKAGLKQYEEDLNGVEMKINELKKSFFSIFGSEDIHRVIALWNLVLESFEEKEPRSN